MSKNHEIIGNKYGRLSVIKKDDEYKDKNHTKWICECDCGKIISAYRSALISGRQVSCGCYKKEIASARLKETMRKSNVYNLSGEYGVGSTFNTNRVFYFDLEDYEKIKNYCWREDSNGYIVSNDYKNDKKIIYMHRIVCDVNDKNIEVDHCGHNTFDNRKINLRIASHTENHQNNKMFSNNTSGATGVYYDKRYNKWQAYITCDNKRISLGQYDVFADAIKARKIAEEKYFKSWSYDNSMSMYEANKP